MKRAGVAVITFLFLFSISGCARIVGKSFKAENIVFTFQCKANVAVDGKKTEYLISRSAPGVISIQITSGEMSGLTYFWKDTGFSVSYSGLTAESEDCVLPKTSFANLLKQTLDSASSAEALTPTHGNEFSGSSAGYDYTITVDEETGKIRTISIPKYAVTAEFHHYSELGV